MLEEQSEIGRDAQLAMLLQHKWLVEIDRAVDTGIDNYVFGSIIIVFHSMRNT